MGRKSKTPRLRRVAINESDRFHANCCAYCGRLIPVDVEADEFRHCGECDIPDGEAPIRHYPWLDAEEQGEINCSTVRAWIELQRAAAWHFLDRSFESGSELLERALEAGAKPIPLIWGGLDWEGDLRELAVELVMRIDEGEPAIQRFLDAAEECHRREQEALR